jgi:Putative metallopeptidase
MKSISRLLLLGVLAGWATPGVTAAEDVHPQRIKIEVYPPKSPEQQQAYDLVTRRHWLEKAQEIFGIFKLPQDITIFARSCGMSNAWYVHGTVTICHEYIDDIIKSMPEETTPEGITQSDTVAGQFAYTLAHEMGHALFDILDIPLLGQPEDAADEFSAYMLLDLGNEEAHRFILGAAYSYANYMKNPRVTVSITAFADSHGAPMQRYYNLLCMAYGADREMFQVLVDKVICLKLVLRAVAWNMPKPISHSKSLSLLRSTKHLAKGFEQRLVTRSRCPSFFGWQCCTRGSNAAYQMN